MGDQLQDIPPSNSAMALMRYCLLFAVLTFVTISQAKDDTVSIIPESDFVPSPNIAELEVSASLQLQNDVDTVDDALKTHGKHSMSSGQIHALLSKAHQGKTTELLSSCQCHGPMRDKALPGTIDSSIKAYACFALTMGARPLCHKLQLLLKLPRNVATCVYTFHGSDVSSICNDPPAQEGLNVPGTQAATSRSVNKAKVHRKANRKAVEETKENTKPEIEEKEKPGHFPGIAEEYLTL